MTISLVFLNLLSFKLEFLLKTKGIPVNNVETKKQTKQNKTIKIVHPQLSDEGHPFLRHQSVT